MAELQSTFDNKITINADLSVTILSAVYEGTTNSLIEYNSVTLSRAEAESMLIPTIADWVNSASYAPQQITPITLGILEFGILNGNWTKAQADNLLNNAIANNAPFNYSFIGSTVPYSTVASGQNTFSGITSPNPQLSVVLTGSSGGSSGGASNTVGSDKSFVLTSTTNADVIQKAYIAYFNRPADPQGFNYWDSMLKSGTSINAAFELFSTSTEYNVTYAGMDSSQRINAIYQGLFGRSAEQAGLDYWKGLLDSGALTVANIVSTVMAGALNEDAVVVSNRVSAAKTFTGSLNTDSLVSSYNGQQSAAVAKSWLSSVNVNTSSITSASQTLSDAVKKIALQGTITTGSSGDTIALKSGAAETICYSKSDVGTTDRITGWESGDKISLSAAITKTGSTTSLSLFTSDATSLITSTNSSMYTQGERVALAHVGNDSVLYVDVNGDKVFNPASDITIVVVGANITASDIVL